MWCSEDVKPQEPRKHRPASPIDLLCILASVFAAELFNVFLHLSLVFEFTVNWLVYTHRKGERDENNPVGSRRTHKNTRYTIYMYIYYIYQRLSYPPIVAFRHTVNSRYIIFCATIAVQLFRAALGGRGPLLTPPYRPAPPACRGGLLAGGRRQPPPPATRRR